MQSKEVPLALEWAMPEQVQSPSLNLSLKVPLAIICVLDCSGLPESLKTILMKPNKVSHPVGVSKNFQNSDFSKPTFQPAQIWRSSFQRTPVLREVAGHPCHRQSHL